MSRRIRLALAAVVASTALLGGAVVAPAAHAAPTGEAQAAKTALDNIQSTDAAGVIDGIEAANALLKKLGITPFSPTVGACTDFTLAPALGGAMPGPNTPLLGDLTYTVPILGTKIDINAIRKGEVMYGFVPVGTFDDSGSKKGMQVAWFNINTFKGGLSAPMDGLGETLVKAVAKRLKEGGVPFADKAAETALRPVTKLLPSNGVRGGLVDTGAGTVLSAIYGTIKKGDATCYFFPSLGVATAK